MLLQDAPHFVSVLGPNRGLGLPEKRYRGADQRNIKLVGTPEFHYFFSRTLNSSNKEGVSAISRGTKSGLIPVVEETDLEGGAVGYPLGDHLQPGRTGEGLILKEDREVVSQECPSAVPEPYGELWFVVEGRSVEGGVAPVLHWLNNWVKHRPDALVVGDVYPIQTCRVTVTRSGRNSEVRVK